MGIVENFVFNQYGATSKIVGVDLHYGQSKISGEFFRVGMVASDLDYQLLIT